jgi:lipoprotein-anchoring transpeptidase ErfK/SrfK
MGRTVAAVLVLGLLAAAGWRLFGPAGPAGPAGEDASAVPLREGATAPEEGGAAPVPASFAPGARAAPAEARPSPEGEAIRALLREGRSGEAVARASALPVGSLGDPGTAGAARDAACALAGGSGAPEGRIARLDAARRLLGRLAVEDALPLAAVRESLEALNREVLLGRREVPGVVFRGVVKPGDTLDRLMRREWKGRVRAGFGAVLWMNNVTSADRLRVGTLWVPEEPVRVLVHKGSHSLWVLLGEVPVRFYAVGLGMNGRTPEGTFEVEEMLQRPDYWPPGGKRIPFGQKGNPLGTRWMGFRDTPDAQGYGIHGTDEPDSIGKDLSQGCVRLRNAEVEQLFTWVLPGTTVEIRR